MTDDELAFQKELDADPANHFIRLLLSEHLQEYSDSRWMGYRWLSVNKKCPYVSNMGTVSYANYSLGTGDYSDLPDDWYAHIIKNASGDDWNRLSNGRSWVAFVDRQSADDAAAIAFSQLPLHRQAELLALNLEAV